MYPDCYSILLIVLSYYLLWDKHHMIFYYNIGTFINTIINVILKGIIQEARPNMDEKKMNLLKTNAKPYFFQHGIPFDLFGMPSGHAQLSFFTTSYVYFVLRKTNWLYVYCILSMIICYQQINNELQSILQVIVGACIGIVIGYCVYMFSKEKIKGHIREKPDEYAPV